jgi:hypothetical protein
MRRAVSLDRARVPALPRALLLAVMLAVAAAGAARVDAAWPGLRGVKRVAVEVLFAPDHPLLAPEVVEKRIEDALLASPIAPRPDPRSTDRLRLVVSVRQVTSNDLRGYYLPMSGSYGIGMVRLAVERQMIVPGSPPGSPPAPAVSAIVWQVERQALGPWRRSREQIMALIDDLVATLIDDMPSEGS